MRRSLMRRYINIIEGFGRMGAASPSAAARDPADLNLQSAVAIARRYPTAEAYANDLNPISLSHGDPPNIVDRHDREHERLANRWENWRESGYIVPATGII